MSRWPPGAAQRLYDAAMALFAEQGFAATTVPQITARAGLTTRSFFRWYPDKRELLFVGEDELPQAVEEVFAAAPPGLGPLEVIRFGLVSVLSERFEALRPDLEARWRVVREDEGLLERHAHRLALVESTVAAGFARRGLGPGAAATAARLTTAVYDLAVRRWLEEGGSFRSRSEEVVAEARAALGDAAEPGA